jgi:hypothetical protein
VLSTSDDGVNWSEVRRIPINDGGDHFIPGIGVRAGGTSRPAACQLRVGYVQSNDGGGHWSNPQTLAGPFPVSWTPDTSQGHMVGDYISTAWIGTKAFGAFAVAAAPSGSVFDQKIFVPAGGVSASSFPNAMVAEKSFSDNSARHANTHSVIRPARKEE